MKLFKSLLVAPATLGLLAPLAATANEITVNDFNPVVEETLLAGGEGLVDDHSHDGSFSETTTASFSADFAIGAVDGSGISTGVTDGTEALETYYGFQIDLTTSFTGEEISSSRECHADCGARTIIFRCSRIIVASSFVSAALNWCIAEAEISRLACTEVTTRCQDVSV